MNAAKSASSTMTSFAVETSAGVTVGECVKRPIASARKPDEDGRSLCPFTRSPRRTFASASQNARTSETVTAEVPAPGDRRRYRVASAGMSKERDVIPLAVACGVMGSRVHAVPSAEKSAFTAWSASICR
jgi:hypothetical protein